MAFAQSFIQEKDAFHISQPSVKSRRAFLSVLLIFVAGCAESTAPPGSARNTDDPPPLITPSDNGAGAPPPNQLRSSRAMAMSASSEAVLEWSTAVSKHATENRVVIYRYASRLQPGLDRAAFSAKIVVHWSYAGTSGMPAVGERERMDHFEDLLAPTLGADNFSVLALVSTGENLRTWVYYARSSEQFMLRFNGALAYEQPFPIDVQLGVEPAWDEYENFRSGVQAAGEG